MFLCSRLCKGFLITAIAVIYSFIIDLPLEVQAKGITKSKKYAAIVYDINSNKIIYGRNMDKRRYPASLTKVMTLYMLFEALDAKRISLRTKMKISRNAARQPASHLGLKAGRYISVQKAIQALIVRSANDVAVVVGEFLGGSEKKFAKLLTAKAREIGMRNTVFKNASGLPNKRQYTTARDMIIMSKRIMHDFHQYYHYFKLTKFSYRGKTFYTHNKLVLSLKGVQGMKTGYIRASGYNVINSYKKNGYHLLAVVMGGKNSVQRDKHMERLIYSSVKRARKAGERALMTNELPEIPQKKPILRMANLHVPQKPNKHAISDTKASDSDTVLTQLIKEYIDSDEKIPEDINDPKYNVSFTHNDIYKKGQIAANKDKLMHKKPAHDEWHIQIGAYYSSLLAQKRNKIAMAKYPMIFEGHDAYVMKSGKRIYRSRFKGYSAQSANKACATLRSKGIDCIKLRQL